MRDVGRVRYMMEYLSGVHKAIEEGVNVVGYTMWSLMDNFEWSEGYSARFGLLHVDFNSASRTRTPKQSFYCYQEIVANNYLPSSDNCPLDYLTDEKEIKSYGVKLYGVSQSNVVELLDSAYKFSIRYAGSEFLVKDGDSFGEFVTGKINFVVDHEDTVTEDYVYDQFKQFVKDTCGSLFSEKSCDRAWGLVPKVTMEKGSPGTVHGNCAVQNVCDAVTTNCVSSSAEMTECECRDASWSLVYSESSQFCMDGDAPLTDAPVTDAPVTDGQMTSDDPETASSSDFLRFGMTISLAFIFLI